MTSFDQSERPADRGLFGEEVTLYVPEPEYFEPVGELAIPVGMHATARCLVHLATRYRAWFVVGPPAPPPRDGPIPTNASAREALVDELAAWLKGVPLPDNYPRLTGLRLFSGERCLLDNHGDLSETFLALTAGEFASLQGCLTAAGLPRDLYFPLNARREVVEPVEWLGGVVLLRKPYSPVAWRRRGASGPPPRVPSERERRKRFAADCAQFGAFVEAWLAAYREGAGATDVRREQMAAVLLQLDGVRARLNTDQALAPTGMVRTEAPLTQAFQRFIRALDLRQAELREPGRTGDQGELEEVEQLDELVRAAFHQRGSLPFRP